MLKFSKDGLSETVLQGPIAGPLPGQWRVDQWSILYLVTLVTPPVSTWTTLKGPSDTALLAENFTTAQHENNCVWRVSDSSTKLTQTMG